MKKMERLLTVLMVFGAACGWAAAVAAENPLVLDLSTEGNKLPPGWSFALGGECGGVRPSSEISKDNTPMLSMRIPKGETNLCTITTPYVEMSWSGPAVFSYQWKASGMYDNRSQISTDHAGGVIVLYFLDQGGKALKTAAAYFFQNKENFEKAEMNVEVPEGTARFQIHFSVTRVGSLRDQDVVFNVRQMQVAPNGEAK